MFINSSKIIKIMNEIAPEKLAKSWDNVGLLIGNADSEVDRILVALEVTKQVVDEAITRNIDLIICHHPLIFKPMKKIVESEPTGSIVRKLIKNDISVYAAHTNLDIAEGGTNDYICQLLELMNVSGLERTGVEAYKKLVVYVPQTDAEAVRTALATAGAGKLSNYEACSFTVKGEGAFKPLEGANPAIGSVGALERVEEVKIEVVVKADQIDRVLSQMLKAHPYEVPAYDIFSLDNLTEASYLGRVGHLGEKHTLSSLAELVKDKLGVETLRYVGDAHRAVRKVAICTGAGSDMMKAAASRGCDTLITGDVKYHEAQEALQMNIALIDAGHFETEQIYIKKLAEKLEHAFSLKSYEVAVLQSETETTPFRGV